MEQHNPHHQEVAVDKLEDDIRNPTERTLLVVKTPATTAAAPVTRSYTIRWFVLVVFTLNTAASNVIWATILPIGAVAACYYGVGLGWINALTLCFFATYIFLFAPAAKLLEEFGIRSAVIITACLNSAGAWLRLSGSGPNLFWLMLVGQTIAAMGCVITWTGPSLLSSVWFPPSERAIATAISGAVAPQIGLLLGAPFGPFLVHSPDTFTVCNTSDPVPRSSPIFIDWQAKIHLQLLYYLLVQAILIFLLIPLSFCVPAVPSVPPSLSRQLQNKEKKSPVVRSVLDLLKNPYYIMLNITFTLFVAVSSVFNTIIEELLVAAGYESYQNSMGYLGIIVALINTTGVLIIGIWLSYSKMYYFTGILLSAVFTVFAIGFSIVIHLKLNFYLVAILYSFAQMGGMAFQGFAYEYAVEVTYPQPESISAALLNAASQLFGIILLYAVLPMIVPSLAVYCSWLLTGLVLIGSFIMVFNRPKLRRIEIDT